MSTTYVIGPFVLDPESGLLALAGVPLPLGPRGVAVLTSLVRKPNELVRKSSILDTAWPDVVVDENNLSVQISAIRRALAKVPGGDRWVETMPRRGYRFVGPVVAVGSRDGLHVATDADRLSIAVLPLVNLSDDAADDYFADGLSEEMLNLLTRIPGLRVASRTSVFYFKGKAVDVPAVGKALNVATVLEGSVRKAGQRVRLSVQLTHVASNAHLWSGTYDRTVDDAFSLQDDIALEVVRELRSVLRSTSSDTGSEVPVAGEVARATRRRTRSVEAYRMYLQGRHFASRGNLPDLNRGIEYFHQALNVDPGYAMAWVALAGALSSQAGYGRGAPVVEGFWLARTAAKRALALEPDFAEAYAILSWICLYGDWNWKGADEMCRRAVELAPDSSYVLHSAFIVAGNLGRHADAEAHVRRALLIDPLNARLHQLSAWAKLHGGDLDGAEAALVRAEELSPGISLVGMCAGLIRMAQGRVADALAEFEREVLEDYRWLGIAIAQHSLGRVAESDAALDAILRNFGDTSPNQIAEAYAARGEHDRAFEWLDRACAIRDPRTVEARESLILRPLHSDERWLRFVRQVGFES